MSAPVLSWLFNISREAHAETQTTPCGTDSRLEPTSPESFAVRPVKNSPLKSPERQPFFDPVLPTQPLEPIFFPKLQIYFADFPYLHCSIDQRLFTLETCCGFGYGLERKLHCLPRIFKGQRRCTGRRVRRDALRMQRPYLWTSQFQGVRS